MYSIKLTPKCVLWIDEDRVYQSRIFVCTKTNKQPAKYNKRSRLKWFYTWQGAIKNKCTRKIWLPLLKEAAKYLPDTYKGMKHVETTDPAWVHRMW